MLKNITGNEAKKLWQEGAIFIDIRDKEEYEQEKIQGAINIELNDIDSITTKDIAKEKNIVVYCTSGVRSIVAGERLCELGYKRVYNLMGGVSSLK